MSKPKTHSPPKLAVLLLSISVAWKFKEEAETDLNELFQIRLANHGLKYARRQYWRDVLSIWSRRSWFEEFEFTHLNTFSMFKNYMKVTFRNLRKQKIYTSINILGLAMGLAFCCLIFLYVQDELSFDNFHEKGDRIYRVERVSLESDGTIHGNNPNNSIPLGPALVQDIPGISTFTRLYNESLFVKSDGDPIQELITFSDPEVTDIFSFTFISGNPENALSNPGSVIISYSAARKYFNNTDPLGKTLQVRLDQTYEPFTVTGVYLDQPKNSTVDFNIVLPIAVSPYYTPDFIDRWSMSIYHTYVLVNDQIEGEDLNPNLDDFFNKYHDDYIARVREQQSLASDAQPLSYRLNKLTDIHLNSVSDPMYSFILSGIALGMLLIACINFMTLSIGRSSKRSKEIGLRKVIGAYRHQLMAQFWGEAFVICFISLILGIVLAEAALPVFNSLSGKMLNFNYFDNRVTLLVLGGFVVFTGLLAGSYPAVILSGIKPVVTLKGSFKLNGANLFTRSLVVVQFALSVLLIIGTLVMKNQMDFIQEQDLGYDKEQVVTIDLNGMDGIKLANQFRNTIGDEASIVDISAMGNSLGRRGSYGYGYNYNDQHVSLNVFTIESNYLDILGLELVDGRNFNPDLSTDSLNSVLVNETLVKELELEDPVGKEIPGFDSQNHGKPVIIGVVKDHYFQSMYNSMEPAFFTINPVWGHSSLLIRIRPENTQQSLALISDTWKLLVPEIPFSYSFLDDELNKIYQNDQRWTTIINYSSFFAILIACMGLFGLVTLTVSSREKEVGIRKVLGATITQITSLFAKDFVKLVALGVFIATPIAWYFMNQWLTNFAYHISIGPVHFIIAAVLVLTISLITISVQTIRAGSTNPAETLMND